MSAILSDFPVKKNTIIPKSTIFGSANWFQTLVHEQQILVTRIDQFATKAKREQPTNDVELHAQKWLYDWAFEQISAKHNDWEMSMFIPLQFQVDEIANGDTKDCLTLFYRYGDNEEHAYFKIFLI